MSDFNQEVSRCIGDCESMVIIKHDSIVDVEYKYDELTRSVNTSYKATAYKGLLQLLGIPFIREDKDDDIQCGVSTYLDRNLTFLREFMDNDVERVDIQIYGGQ